MYMLTTRGKGSGEGWEASGQTSFFAHHHHRHHHHHTSLTTVTRTLPHFLATKTTPERDSTCPGNFCANLTPPPPPPPFSPYTQPSKETPMSPPPHPRATQLGMLQARCSRPIVTISPPVDSPSTKSRPTSPGLFFTSTFSPRNSTKNQATSNKNFINIGNKNTKKQNEPTRGRGKDGLGDHAHPTAVGPMPLAFEYLPKTWLAFSEQAIRGENIPPRSLLLPLLLLLLPLLSIKLLRTAGPYHPGRDMLHKKRDSLNYYRAQPAG